MLARGETVPCKPLAYADMVGSDWPRNLEQFVYVDGYGNLMTGVDAKNFNKNRCVRVSGRMVKYAETFCRVPAGGLFWYPNSLGLVEIAANQGSAAELLSLALGDKILLD